MTGQPLAPLRPATSAGQRGGEINVALDTVLAKWAGPGMCDRADESPTVDGQPSDDRIAADMRSPACRIRSIAQLKARHVSPIAI